MARSILEEVRVAFLFARVGERLERVDLFDLRALEPFARRAVEGVLVWVIAASFTSILFAGGWASATLPQLVATILLSALVAFVLPLLGVHRCLRAAKQQELERIHAAARTERDALLRRRARVAGGSLHPDAPAPLPRHRPRLVGERGAGGSRGREAAALSPAPGLSC